MGYIHFSEDEKNRANSVNIVSYLQSKGESVKRCGNEHSWESPSGKVSLRGSDWYSQYEQVGGGPVSFVQKFYGLNYPEAVTELLGNNSYELAMSQDKLQKKAEHKELVIPPRNNDMRRAYAYLLGERFIDRDVLNVFAHSGLIYEDAEHHNVVFVGKDSEGNPKHIQKRGTHSKSSYKGNVEGSDANYSFRFLGKSNKLYVFEAPIDMLAYISLHKENWTDHSYVALCSTADCSAIQILETNENIDTVYLCLDHDSAGIVGAYRVAESIHALGDYSVWRSYPKHKDWDEDLKALNGKEAVPSSEHPKLINFKKTYEMIEKVDIIQDSIYQELSRSKGYLVEDTIKRMRSSLSAFQRSTFADQKKENLYRFSKYALAFCCVRNEQLQLNYSQEQWKDEVFKAYKLHKDAGSSGHQYDDLMREVNALEKKFDSQVSFTADESVNLCKEMCSLAMNGIRLASTIDCELSESQAPTLTM